ncbi:adenylate/guanylate cyclase domain-containing protein [uncultured Bradyrhizobium sp.]|uniref:adenylate/guanylate cyclase domain-containing protein n=1 Tax=Bradyrhizobium sp. TaxID=376 RepID=UPI00260CF1B8|nr:adenylate/guanylate cyclase domain-containing protein [uncultured Bradyrhizobium sp.]
MVQERPVRVERRLSAILAADVAGYSRLMHGDEEGTHAKLAALLTDAVDPAIAEHRGRIVKSTGDGFLAEFPSAVEAVRAAMQFQARIKEITSGEAEDKRIAFRVGVNIGDVIIEAHDIFGDDVNIAARLESIAEPGGICISQAVLNHSRDKVLFNVEDAGEQTLKNIARPVHVYRIMIDPNGWPATSRGEVPALALPDKPSIAVLPFQNMSGDPEQEYFADGMVEEIITTLSRVRQLFVIARNSSFTYKGRAVDIKQVGRELGVRYVLEGSVRKSANRVRITGQLINAATGAHLWADHFDGALDDIFDLQDRVAVEVCGIIGTALEAAEQRRSLRKPTDDLTAYDLYLRALAEAQSWEKVRILRALDLLKQALDRDPNYGPALALAATCHANLYVNNWTDDLELTRREGFDLARRVLLIVDDPSLVARGAYALAQFGDDLATATTLIDRALHLNPSFAYGWIWSGWVRLFAGKPELAIEHFKTAIRLSPREGTAGAGAHVGIGIGHLFARRFEEAEAMLLLALRERPSWAPTYRFLASCYAHMGRLDEARSIVKRLRDITPVVVPSATHWRDPGYREFYLQGLRLAADQPE